MAPKGLLVSWFNRCLIRFFVDFPRLAYTFCNGDTISATASTHQLNADNKFYVVIVNPSTSDVDASIRGKWGMYRISANDGNELTPDLKLGAAISGIAHTTVGGVRYDADLNTDVHPSGSLVYLANQYGKPLFRTVGLAKRATRRGYGKFRNLRLTDKQEGGYIREVYIASIFGQKPVADRRDRFPGVIVLHHTGKYPGWNHPETNPARGGQSSLRFSLFEMLPFPFSAPYPLTLL